MDNKEKQLKSAFLDTNIWIELLALRTPQEEHEKKQSAQASALLKSLLSDKRRICSCYEQLIEIVNAIQKVKQKAFSKKQKEAGYKGIGSVKEYRRYPEFSATVAVCKMAIEDIKHMAEVEHHADVPIEQILDNLHLIDINDYIYYNYCKKNNLEMYTFDKELKELDKFTVVTLLS